VRPRLLVLDDDRAVCAAFAVIGEQAGYVVETTSDAASFRRAFEAQRPDAVVLDMLVPERDGFEIVGDLAAAGWTGRLVLVSGDGRMYLPMAAALAERKGIRVAACLDKPLDVDACLAALARD
jgi:DNA-binding NtrC family response regulator